MHALSAAFEIICLISTEKTDTIFGCLNFYLEGTFYDSVMNRNRKQLWTHQSGAYFGRFGYMGCSLGCSIEACILKVIAYLSLLLHSLQKLSQFLMCSTNSNTL